LIKWGTTCINEWPERYLLAEDVVRAAVAEVKAAIKLKGYLNFRRSTLYGMLERKLNPASADPALDYRFHPCSICCQFVRFLSIFLHVRKRHNAHFIEWKRSKTKFASLEKPPTHPIFENWEEILSNRCVVPIMMEGESDFSPMNKPSFTSLVAHAWNVIS
jgi:hypothetical protein